ncbi:NrsF family protein [Falsiroseomonas oryziterrae]|uniref:NrsF family protein n=1 Tax=Falsiroseomonas oryziterrae TaxID=2911368 RepID=UPI001F476E3E|nr:NrsF family protein [Roseomonas sp. NPKOSM-4]
MQSEELIGRLAAGLRPVRRAWHPALATAAWATAAGLVIAAGVAWFGMRPDLASRLRQGQELVALAMAAATGLLASFAAFQLALPDRDRRWALLPLPAALAWLATMGWGCLQDLTRFGPEALRLTTSFSCLGFIVGFSLPLTLAILWLARHAAWLRPEPVAALGGLSAAALASVGLALVHHLDAAAMVLVWHGLSVLLVTVLARAAGPLLMRAEA